MLVDLDGVRVLTDPVIRRLVGHLRRSAPLDEAAIRDVDAVLVSHVHFDHLDLPSLERVGRSARIVVPRGAGGLVRRRRLRDVVEVDEGEEIRIGPLAVRATHAEHSADRGPLRSEVPSLGFVLAGSSTVYFVGDTDLFPGLADDVGPDVALLPVTGWGPHVGPGHLDPSRAAEALRLLRPRAAVPIHWGTYRPVYWRGRARTEAPEEFRRLAAELAPEVDVRVLPVGGSLVLPVQRAA